MDKLSMELFSELAMFYRELATRLADGNLGALRVVSDLMTIKGDWVHGTDALQVLLLADLRGPKIWLLFRDLFEDDLRRFFRFICVTGLEPLRELSKKLDDPTFARHDLKAEVESICGVQ